MPVPEASKDQLQALWETGVPLDFAWIEFARFLDAFAIRALHTDPSGDAEVLGLDNPRYIQLSKGWLPPTWEAREKKLAFTTKNERINHLGEIYSGRLWAIGYRTLPSGFDELVRVPRQLFYFDEAGEREQRPDIHWSKGELTAGSTSFFDIRVVHAPSAGEELAAQTGTASDDSREVSDSVNAQRKVKSSKGAAKTPDTKRDRKRVSGRTNTSRRIRREFRRLWDTSTEFRNFTIKRMIPEVRAVLLGKERRHEEASGYRSSSMAKIIGQEAAALRNRNKRNKPNKPKAT